MEQEPDIIIAPPRHTPIVALIGRPNVGKSTLFNRLVRSRQAIVDPTPGVTRDRHYERVTWDGKPFMLVDTGGIEAGAEGSMASHIREQSMQAVREAEVIVLLLDGREGLTALDNEIAELLRRADKPVYYAVNKVDGAALEEKLLAQFFEIGAPDLWPVSAEHGYGVEALFDRVVADFPETGQEEGPADNYVRIAFLGRPNVGKSSLVNRVLGEERMLVSEIPGTTRDSVNTLLTRGERSYLLIDTAGIRRKGKVKEKIEKFSVIRALATLERCDLVLLLIDAGEGITEQDTKVIGYIQDSGRGCILVINKWDLLKEDPKRQKQLLEEVARATQFVGFAPVLKVSALTGAGVSRLFPTIGGVAREYGRTLTTSKVNQVLQEAVSAHPPAMYQSHRLKFYYATQVATKPPTFVLFTNYPKGVHFSYYRFLVNQFRAGLGLERTPLKILLKERKRKKYD